MTLSELRERFRILVPSAKESKISNAQLDVLLNQGVNEVNLISKVYHGYTEFDSAVDQVIYPISTNIPKYLGMHESGAWLEDSNSNLKRLFPRDRKWLDYYKENWRDDSSGEPMYYAIDGDDFLLNPPHDTAGQTIRVYHLIIATDMSNGNNYPWKNMTTEITAFRPLDDAIIDYARWRAQDILGKSTEGTLAEADFRKSAALGAMRVKRRPDVTSDHYAGRMKF